MTWMIHMNATVVHWYSKGIWTVETWHSVYAITCIAYLVGPGSLIVQCFLQSLRGQNCWLSDWHAIAWGLVIQTVLPVVMQPPLTAPRCYPGLLYHCILPSIMSIGLAAGSTDGMLICTTGTCVYMYQFTSIQSTGAPEAEAEPGAAIQGLLRVTCI